jgi:segregation and condensation protein B
MSLKAKVEAVVYAAEEPVTLAQLAVIFSEEVLHELAQAAAAAGPEAEMETPAEQPPTLEWPSDVEPVAEEAPVPVAGADSPATGLPEESAAEAAPEAPAAANDDAEKKAARNRDRRVRQHLEQLLNELIADYSRNERGMEIREIAGGYRMATKPEYHDAVRGLVKSLKPPMKLSLQALETLAVIAYKQPVTAPEVSEIRGVDSGGVLGGLVSRKLITTAGRKPVIGRPILYKTTKEFLLRFGLKDVNDLPSMEEFEKMASELAESEAEGEAQDAALQFSEGGVPTGEPAVESTAEPIDAPSLETSSESVPEAEAEPVVGAQLPEAQSPEAEAPEAENEHSLTSPSQVGES